MARNPKRSLRNLFGTDPSIVGRFFSQLSWRKPNTRYISVVCRRNLDQQLAASYAAVNAGHDIELHKIDIYYIGPDGKLMIELIKDHERLDKGRDEWLHNCKTLVKTLHNREVIGNPDISEFRCVMTAEDYLSNHVFGHDPIYKPFISDLLARLEQFAVECNRSSDAVLGVELSGKFVFAWTTPYNHKLGPHVDSEPSLLLHVGGELPDGTKQSRGAGVLSPRNIAFPDDDKLVDPRRVSYLRAGDFAICAGGIQGRLTKKVWRVQPDAIGGLHTNAVINTGHPKEPVFPEGSVRRSLISYAT